MKNSDYTIADRAEEIEALIITDTISLDGDTGLESFIAFITSEEITSEEAKTLNDVIVAALSAPFAERYSLSSCRMAGR
jgi:hypothetical protein